MKKINSIQGLRTILFIQVIMAHSYYLVGRPYLTWFNSVPWALELFYLISGFGIVLGYQHRLDQYPNRLNVWIKFLFSRIKKVYLLHITMLVISAVYLGIRFKLVHEVVPLKTALISFFSQAFFCLSWIPVEEYYQYFNAATWFLCSLMFCYFLSIPCLHFLKKQKDYRKLTVMLIILKLIVSSIPIDQFWVHRWPIGRFTDFFLGMLCAEFYLNKKKVDHEAALQTIATVALIITVLICSPYYHGVKIIHPNALLAIPGFFFVRYISYDGPVGRFLSNKVLVWIGNITMELYLIHPIVIRFIWSYWSMKGHDLNLILVLIEIAVTFVLAIAWNRLVTRKIHW